MAFTVTARQSGNSGSTSSATFTTGSATPTANSLFVVFSGGESDGVGMTPAIQTPVGDALTFTLVAKGGESPTYAWSNDGGYKVSAAMFRAPVGSTPSAFAVTVDHWADASAAFYSAICLDITGHDTTTPVVQSKVAGGQYAANDAQAATVTLDSTPSVGQLVIFAVEAASDSGGGFATPTAGVGKTFAPVTVQNTGYQQAAVWYRIWDGTESTTITCSDLGTQTGAHVAVAAVVAPATGGGTTTPVTATRATTWDVRTAVSSTRATTWNVASALTPVTSTRATTWRVRARVTSTRATTWNTLGTLAPFVTAISSNGRYFVDQNGDPILIKGDSPWAILVDASTAQMDLYVSTRQAQGFNTVLLGLLGSTGLGGPSDTGATYDGILPFVGGDPTVLNNAYWTRVEYFLGKCRDAGISVMAYPIDGWNTLPGAPAASWSNATAQAYGQAVAARLSSYPNVFWAIGGDYTSDNGGTLDQRQYNVLVGLAAGGMDRLRTAQFTLNQTSLSGSTYWDDAGRVDFNFVYAYSTTYPMVEAGWNETDDGGNHIPSLMSEAHYEGYGGITDLYIRQQAAWSLTAGSPGEFYGHEEIWDAPPTTLYMETTAVAQLSALRAEFEDLDGWHSLVPDYSSTFITAGRGTKASASGEYISGNAYVTGGVTPDGKLGVAYVPNATGSTITINQTKMGVGYTARWVDPTNGNSVSATPGATYSKTGANAAGGSDWLLVLESAGSVLASVTATRSTTWRTRAAATSTRSTTWDTRTSVTATRATSWDVRTSATATRSTSWDTQARIERALATTWDVRTQVTAQRSSTWNVVNMGSVTSSRSTTWRTVAQATSTRATTWDTRAAVTNAQQSTWDVRVSVTKQAAATSWRTLGRIAVTRATSWAVLVDTTGYEDITVVVELAPRRSGAALAPRRTTATLEER